ncbi:hypothetical protein [Sphingobium yanoikuyae]|uniref:hypothetical protein n=1 Tax=Sphingobium yanoikuyae TaxID=13690 RepID=UPI0031E14071
MVKFVKLPIDGGEYFVNPEAVSGFHKKSASYTSIGLLNGKYFDAKATPDEVLRILTHQ